MTNVFIPIVIINHRSIPKKEQGIQKKKKKKSQKKKRPKRKKKATKVEVLDEQVHPFPLCTFPKQIKPSFVYLVYNVCVLILFFSLVHNEARFSQKYSFHLPFSLSSNEC